jgi:hypothetical protein
MFNIFKKKEKTKKEVKDKRRAFTSTQKTSIWYRQN